MYSTSLCYLERDGKWLMLHRVTKKNDINEGKYVGIGGKFLEGESPEECAAREVFEETGYTLTSYRYAGIVTFVSDRYEAEHMHLFSADGFTGGVSRHGGGNFFLGPEGRSFKAAALGGGPHFSAAVTAEYPVLFAETLL